MKIIKKIIKKILRAIQNLTMTAEEKRHAAVGPAKLWKMTRDFQFKFLVDQGLGVNHRLVDIGCGTLRGGIPLIDKLDVGHYYGIDVRAEVLDKGRDELREQGLEFKKPNLIAFDDFSDLDLNEKVEYAFAFSVLIHLSDDIAEKCFQFVGRSLAEGGRFLANVNVEEHRDGEWRGFPVVFRSIKFYEEIASRSGLNTKYIGTLAELGRVSGYPLGDKQVMLEFSKA